MAGHDGGRVENLTGQRHENSVLFSLSNLQSLAMPSAEAVVAGGARPARADDRRLGPDRHPRHGGQHARPVPADGGRRRDDGRRSAGLRRVLAGGAVLLPMPSSSGPPKWIYLVIVGMLGLVGVDRLRSPGAVISPEAGRGGEGGARCPRRRRSRRRRGRRKTPPPTSKKPTTIADENLPPREGERRSQGGDKGEQGQGERASPPARAAEQGSQEGARRSADEKKAAAAAPPIAEPPRRSPPRDRSTICSTTPRRSRRQRARGSTTTTRRRRRRLRVAGPLSKNASSPGMNGVKPKVTACYNQFKVPGMAMVNVVIGKNGKVTLGDGDRQVRRDADGRVRRDGGQVRQLPAVRRPHDAVPVPAEVRARHDVATATRRSSPRSSARSAGGG